MHRFTLRVGLMMTALVSLVAARPVAAADEALPTDPALVTGQLDNGLRYIVRKHSVPPGRATVWVHMHTGSLNETDRQRGIAHYLEHMAFNGSNHFKPGELVPFFQSLGMTFGRDQNAFTSFDQTTFQLSLPDTKPETLGKGMTFFSDVVGGLCLLPTEIDNERQIILEERRTRLSGRQRTSDAVLERQFPGSIFGFRQPIGTEKTVKEMAEQDFKDYYGKWYCASNATLLVVADTDPQEVVKVIKEQFNDLPKRQRPTPQDLGVKAYDKSFAIVASDPEIRSAELSIVKAEPAHPPVATVDQYRRELVLDLAEQAMNHRMSEKVSAGKASYLSGRVGSGDDARAIHTAEISARAVPGKWKDALREVALDVQTGRAFGFTAHELDRVNKEMISAAEWSVETESTATAQAIISRLNSSIADERPFMAPRQRLDLLKRLLPTIKPEECAKRFAEEYEPKAVAIVAVLPGSASASIPKESELLEMGTAALAVKPTQIAEDTHDAKLMETPPPPGKIAEGADHAASGVWSGWLSNNVRVLYKFMDTRKDEVSINVSLLGGELLETADNRGITRAAQLAWSRPATAHLTSADIREIMSGKKIAVGGGGMGGGRRGGGRRGGGMAGGGGDAISLSIAGAPDELETGLQLAYLLLTEPKIEQAGFNQYKTNAREMLAESMTNPMMLGMRTAGVAPYPESEIRLQPVTDEQIARLSLESSQSWLDKLIKESPIEIAIVGDMPKDKALDLVAKYLGAVPSRPRVNPELYNELRRLKRPAGARLIERTVNTPTNQAFVLSGFYGADESNRPDVRALNMAARIVSTRMIKQVREDAQLVYSIGASSRPGSTFPGFGVFSAAAPTDPEKVDALVAKISSMYEEFAKTGPADDELEVAKKQFAVTYAEQLKEPGFWSGRLSQLTFRGISLDDLVTEPDAYQKLTAKQVQDTFAKYYAKDNAIVVVVKPEGSAPTTKPAKDEHASAGAGAGATN